MTEETKRKIGLANKGKIRTPEMRLKYGLAKKGTKWSEESRKKMIGNKNSVGKTISEEHKAIISAAHKGTKYFLGKKHTEEWKKNQSKRLIGNQYGKNNKGNILPRGENHPRYIKDRSLLKTHRKAAYDGRYKDWMFAIKKRDGWKCKILNSDCSGRLEAHHILPWRDHPKLRYEINNGISLCHFHHPRKRSEEARLSPYFQELVSKKIS